MISSKLNIFVEICWQVIIDRSDYLRNESEMRQVENVSQNVNEKVSAETSLRFTCVPLYCYIHHFTCNYDVAFKF